MQTVSQKESNSLGYQTDDLDLAAPLEPEHIPLSFAQQRLWFFSQLEPDSALYNVPVAFRLRGALHLEVLQQSLNAIVDRHEALRTNFVSIAGTPAQVIRTSATVRISCFDLSAEPAAQREQTAQNLLKAEARKSFDLSTDLLFSASLIQLGLQEHLLLLNMHHIVSDEWSLRILFRELQFFYTKFLNGAPTFLAELPIQYADFALWQREYLQGGLINDDLEYWKNKLGNDSSSTELPADHPRPAVQTYRGGSVSIALPKAIANRVNEFSRSEGVTLFTTLLTAFKTLLHRYTGQDQVTVGSPISGRNKIETESLIGFFVNTLVLRTTVSGETSFRKLLATVREVTLGAYAHQELPFEKLVERLAPQRTSGQVSYIQVVFALQNVSDTNLHLPGLDSEFLEVESNTAKFDLTFVVRETKEGITLAAEYNSDLFESGTIQRMLCHYGRLLELVIDNPNQSISHLDFLEDTERSQLLIDWNNTKTIYPSDKCIPELFAAQVKRAPESVAVVYGEHQLTYRELDERSNQLAHSLRKAGVGPDVLVGICVGRSVEMVVGLLGILKAGGAYLPLDVDYPSERIAFMLDDAKSSILLTQKSLLPRLQTHTCKIFCLDSDWEIVSREPTTAPAINTKPENLAYVIYTSGSTGNPKGVAVTHRAIARLVFNTNYIQLGPSDRIAQAANSSFDAATFEIWGSLLHGGTMIGFSKDLILSPHFFAEQIRLNKITTIFLTTALFNQLASDVPNAFKSVKNVLFGGEAVDPKWVNHVLKNGAPERLLHVYGPTESTTFASWFEVKAVSPGAKTIPIGRPISNTEFYVLDRQLQPTPIGFPGELHIGGDGLARGYLNRPELNSGRFISNPFSKDPASRLYKTGDIVRYLPDGNLEFVGRIDQQVKIRGFRIEPQEIEAIMKQHHMVKDALVMVKGENSDKKLIAFFVSKDPGASSNENLGQFLKQKLPAYMVPTTLLAIEQFPLNANGKVDRRALPDPDAARSLPDTSFDSVTPLEEHLKAIWEEVMGLKSIAVTENFFELGGHSLLAVRLFAQMEKQLGKKFPLSLLFQSPTIRQLAQTIRQNDCAQLDPCLVEIQPNGSRSPIFWLHTLGGGGGGGVVRYQKMSQLLGPEQPSYGLVAPPEPFTKIETMAEYYILKLRSVQPKGPYYLGGYCFGGVVAFEMAQQLRANGESVALLALLDSSPPNIDASDMRNVAHLFMNFPKRMRRFFKQEPAQMLAAFRRKSRKLERRLSGLAKGQSPQNVSGKVLEDLIDMSQYPKDYKHYAEVHWNALLNYFPKPYPGKVTLFEATQSANLSSAPLWKKVAQGGIDLRPIESTHEKMLEEPYVQLLAAELNKCLGNFCPDDVKVHAA